MSEGMYEGQVVQFCNLQTNINQPVEQLCPVEKAIAKGIKMCEY